MQASAMHGRRAKAAVAPLRNARPLQAVESFLLYLNL